MNGNLYCVFSTEKYSVIRKRGRQVEVVSKFHPKFFGLNVRRNGPPPSICVRSFSPITKNIGLGGFSLSEDWPSCALKATCLQDFGAQDFKAKASRVALRGLNQPVQGFGVSVAHPMIEIRKDRPD